MRIPVVPAFSLVHSEPPCKPSNAVMTPTGLVLYTMLGSLSIFLPSSSVVPIPPLVLVFGFLLMERRAEAIRAVASGILVVSPVAIYLSIVWILIANEPPSSSTLFPAFNQSVFAYVAGITSRLLLFVILLHAALKGFLTNRSLQFLTEIRSPLTVKVLVAMTLSIASTMRTSAEIAWASLVAANLLTPRMSWKNVQHGPLLAFTIWISMVGTLSTRLHTKWMLEDVRTRLGGLFAPSFQKPMTIRDYCWVGAALIAAMASVAGRFKSVGL